MHMVESAPKVDASLATFFTGNDAPAGFAHAHVKYVNTGSSLVLSPPANLHGELTVLLSHVLVPRMGSAKTNTPDETGAYEAKENLRRLLVGRKVLFRVDYKQQKTGRDFCTVLVNASPNNSSRPPVWCSVAALQLLFGFATIRENEAYQNEDEMQILKRCLDYAKQNENGRWGNKFETSRVEALRIDSFPDFFAKNRGCEIPAIIEQVLDASCFRVRFLSSPQKHNVGLVALAGLRTPNKDFHPEFADGAKMFVELRLLQRDVKIVPVAQTNNSIVATVHHRAGSIAEVLLESGYAKIVDWSLSSISDQEAVQALKSAELRAKKNKLRIWAKLGNQDAATMQNADQSVSGGQSSVEALSTAVQNASLVSNTRTWPRSIQSGAVALAERQFKAIVIRVFSPEVVEVRSTSTLNEYRVGLASIRGPSRETMPALCAEAKEFSRSRLIGQVVDVSINFSAPIGNNQEDRPFGQIVYVQQKNNDKQKAAITSNTSSQNGNGVADAASNTAAPRNIPGASKAMISASGSRTGGSASLKKNKDKNSTHQSQITEPEQKNVQGFVKRNIAEELVRNGYASVVQYRRADENRALNYSALLAAEESAKKKQIGVHKVAKTNEKSQPVVFNNYSENLAKAKQSLPFLQREGEIPVIVEHLFTPTRILLNFVREPAKLTLLLSGVKAPRLNDPFGPEAYALSCDTAYQRSGVVTVTGIDKNGGFYGTFRANDSGIDLSVALLEAGFASISDGSHGHKSHLQAAQERAQEKKLGMWHDMDLKAAATAHVNRDTNDGEIGEFENDESNPKFFGSNAKSTNVQSGNDTENKHRVCKQAFFAQVSGYQRPFTLFVQKVGQDGEPNPLIKKFAELHEDPNEAAKLVLENNFTPRRGAFVSARFSMNGTWYRAKITKLLPSTAGLQSPIPRPGSKRSNAPQKQSAENTPAQQNNEKILVQFIDLGVSEALDVGDLRQMPEQYLQVPALALEVKLAYLRDFEANEETSFFATEAARQLHEITFERRLIANIDLPARPNPEDRNRNIEVTLFDLEFAARSDDSPIELAIETSVNCALLRCGAALPDRKAISKLPKIMADPLLEAVDFAKESYLGVWKYGNIESSANDD